MRIALALGALCVLSMSAADADVRDRRSLRVVPGSHRWEHWWAHDGDLYLAAHRAHRHDVTASIADHARALHLRANQRTQGAACRTPKLVSALLEALGDSAPRLRAAAATSLGRLHVPEAAAPIRGLLRRDRNTTVRQAALLALGSLRLAPDLEPLARVLVNHREDRATRAAAAFGLGLFGADAAALQLTSFLFGAEDGKRRRGAAFETKSRYVAVAAITALGLTDAASARDAVRRHLTAEGLEPAIRARLISAASRLGDRSSTADIAAIAAHDDKHVRRAAVSALGMLAPRGDAAVEAALATRLGTDEDAAVRGLAAVSLGLLGGSAATAALARRYEDAHLRVRPYISIGLGLAGYRPLESSVTERLVGDSDPSRHAAHALALGLMDASAAAPALVSVATYTGCPHQRGMTCLALGLVERRDAFDTVLGLLERTPDRQPRIHAAYALAMLDPARASKELKRILTEDGNPSNRRQAALALGTLQTAGARDDLIEALGRRRNPQDVRAAAAIALGRLCEPGVLGTHARLSFGVHDRLDDDPLAHIRGLF